MITKDQTWIRTFTGRQFWPMDPHAEDLNIFDIAHALACQNRFSGHTTVPYSIAQHSCHVHDLIGSAQKFAGLLHDASEAYLVDVPTPVKRQLSNYKEAEERLMVQISAFYGFEWPMHPDVKYMDVVMLKAEQRDLMHYINTSYPDIPAWSRKIVPWGWKKAEAEFLKRFFQHRNQQ